LVKLVKKTCPNIVNSSRTKVWLKLLKIVLVEVKITKFFTDPKFFRVV
jgi:hypothetical protein